MDESQRRVREATGYFVPAAFAGELAAMSDWQLKIVKDMLDSGMTVQPDPERALFARTITDGALNRERKHAEAGQG